MSDNPVLAYGRWLAETPPDWPDAAWEAAHRAFIDIVAVTIAGAVEPVTRRVFATVKEWGAGPAAAIGQGARLAAPWAALVNGTAAHALDFDDNFDPAKAHATAVLAPAILALAEQEGASGRAALDAYVAGLQILGRVGQGVNPTHRNRGWHATATVGAIGAAAIGEALQLQAAGEKQ
jgi:2-methylcitrate dehydratase PrpD